MSNSIYGTKDTEGISFSRVVNDKYLKLYASMNKKINLKNDLGWWETTNLQHFLRKFYIWDDLPSVGLLLASYEVRSKGQRMDLLYLRKDGVLLPCELKIGGKNNNSLGQLLRYTAKLHYHPNLSNLLEKNRKKFLKWLEGPVAINIYNKKYSEFISAHGINEKYIRMQEKSGILMDEEFQPPLLEAVRYLNEVCNFSIQMIQIETYVQESWSPNNATYKFRIDFVDVL